MMMRKYADDVKFVEVDNPRKNAGLVEFYSERGMQKALKNLDGVVLDGKRIKLIEESKAWQRSPSRNSRSRSPRSRSMSHSSSNKEEQSKSRSRSRSPPPKIRSS